MIFGRSVFFPFLYFIQFIASITAFIPQSNQITLKHSQSANSFTQSTLKRYHIVNNQILLRETRQTHASSSESSNYTQSTFTPTNSSMVNLRGTIHAPITRSFRVRPRFHNENDKYASPPINPTTLLSSKYLETNVNKLLEWFQQIPSNNIVCITGAGLSTESGIPDYRGHDGSYQKGHKPMIHDEFMRFESSRQRYWGRSMAGYQYFQTRKPNIGHYSLTKLEKMNKIGVKYNNNVGSLSIITQNVDALHSESGTKHVLELHGRGKRLVCMNCGSHHSRHDFHQDLIQLNQEWIQQNIPQVITNSSTNTEARPDGDASLSSETDYGPIQIPPCNTCDDGFYKPDVVFFGDNVPKDDVNVCYSAIDAADGLLCIGTSLEVHSAYRFVKAAAKRKIPIGILNVGETRAERENDLFQIECEGQDRVTSLLTKIESPVGKTLELCVERMLEMENNDNLTSTPPQ